LHEWHYQCARRPKVISDELGMLILDHPEPIQNLTTWVYEEGSLAPTAKLCNGKSYSIVSDYLGRPAQAYDDKDELVWQVEFDIYGRIREDSFNNQPFIPFRQLGQYEDQELDGLYYNRFRYYDSNTGTYISQDPIGLAGNNPNFYAYTFDSNSEVDLFGLMYTSESRTNNIFRKDKAKNSSQQLSEWRRSVDPSDLKELRTAFLGKDHVKVDKGKWRSLDGKRQFRATHNDYLGKHGMGNPVVSNQRYVHLEFLRETPSVNFVVEKNVHLSIKEKVDTKASLSNTPKINCP
jgi:RHS repeat-associated protein